MDIFQLSLIIATLLCSLVAGFLLAFAIVVMPGIKSLENSGFIQSFQVIDRVIQNGQPLFMLLWVGSVLVLILSAILAFWELNQTGLILMASALILYLLGVQLPTAAVNVPLNNKLQAIDIQSADETKLRAAREDFESRWVRWNIFRTVCAIITSLLLIMLLLLQ